MKTWTIRFRGKDERETLASADAFYLGNKDAIGLTRAEFFSRLFLSDDGTEAAFLSPDESLWNLPGGGRPEPARPLGAEPGFTDVSEQDVPDADVAEAMRTGPEEEEPVGSGPESAAAEEAT